MTEALLNTAKALTDLVRRTPACGPGRLGARFVPDRVFGIDLHEY